MDWFLYDNDPVMKQLKGFIKYNLTGGRRNIWVKLCLFRFQFFYISDFNSFQLKEFKWDCALYFLLSCFDIKLFFHWCSLFRSFLILVILLFFFFFIYFLFIFIFVFIIDYCQQKDWKLSYLLEQYDIQFSEKLTFLTL